MISPKSSAGPRRDPQHSPQISKASSKIGRSSGKIGQLRIPQSTISTQPQDHLPNGVGLLHQLVYHFAGYELVDLHRTLLRLYFAERVFIDDLPVDRIVHELPSEFDPFVDRRRGHPSGFELFVKLFRVACGNLVDPDALA